MNVKGAFRKVWKIARCVIARTCGVAQHSPQHAHASPPPAHVRTGASSDHRRTSRSSSSAVPLQVGEHDCPSGARRSATCEHPSASVFNTAWRGAIRLSLSSPFFTSACRSERETHPASSETICLQFKKFPATDPEISDPPILPRHLHRLSSSFHGTLPSKLNNLCSFISRHLLMMVSSTLASGARPPQQPAPSALVLAASSPWLTLPPPSPPTTSASSEPASWVGVPDPSCFAERPPPILSIRHPTT